MRIIILILIACLSLGFSVDPDKSMIRVENDQVGTIGVCNLDYETKEWVCEGDIEGMWDVIKKGYEESSHHIAVLAAVEVLREYEKSQKRKDISREWLDKDLKPWLVCYADQEGCEFTQKVKLVWPGEQIGDYYTGLEFHIEKGTKVYFSEEDDEENN